MLHEHVNDSCDSLFSDSNVVIIHTGEKYIPTLPRELRGTKVGLLDPGSSQHLTGPAKQPGGP